MLPLSDVDLDLGRLSADLLPDWYEDWVLIARERFRQHRLHALECLCDRLAADGRHALAVQAGMAAVAGEPLRESAYRSLIRAYLAEGNRSEAIRLYRTYRLILANELSLAPSQEMELLLEDSLKVAVGDAVTIRS